MPDSAPDLLLRNCVIFGGDGGRVSIALKDGRIDSVGPSAAAGATTEVDCGGALVSPSWVDSHIHVASAATPGRIDPLAHGPAQGVGAMVDAGSAPPARVGEVLAGGAWVFALANIDSRGIRGEGGVPEISGDAADEALAAHPGRVVGLKVQASQSVLGELALKAIANALAVAERHRVPVMVHVGNPPPPLEAVCDLLRPGDLITHYAHGKPQGATLADGTPLPALRRAYERGVLLDVGHGSSSFSFRRCRELLAAGIKPSSISTDLHAASAKAPVVSLARTMSKLLAMGLTESEVIDAVTVSPALAFGLSHSLLSDLPSPSGRGAGGKGVRLNAAMEANLTLFRVDDRRVEVEDSVGERLVCERWFQPLGCAVAGRWFEAVSPV